MVYKVYLRQWNFTSSGPSHINSTNIHIITIKMFQKYKANTYIWNARYKKEPPTFINFLDSVRVYYYLEYNYLVKHKKVKKCDDKWKKIAHLLQR